MKRHSQLRTNITIVVGIVVLCVSAAAGELWKTSDTGTTWLRENTCTNWVLYNACLPEPGTGYAVGAVEEACPPHGQHPLLPATLLSGTVLQLPGNRAARLLDILGRKVLDLRPGANDVFGLVPGVCFVRAEQAQAQAQAQALRKVLIVR